MLFVRRTAPEGSYFEDGDRAAGVFGVIATGFAVMLGFVIFLAFESYDTSRSRRRDRGAGRRAAVPDGAAPPGRRPRAAVGRARLLRAQRRPQRVAADAHRATARQPDQPWSVAMFKTMQTSSRSSVRAGGVRQVARPADRPPIGPHGPHPRRRGRDPGAALDRAVPLGRDHLRLHALLRRQRRAGARPGDDDGRGHGDDQRDAAPALVPRQPLSLRRRRPAADGDGAHARDPRPAGEDRRDHVGDLRRARGCRARAGRPRSSGGAAAARRAPR